MGIVDASHRTSGNLFAVGGHVVLILNKFTLAASTIHWSSKKIERVVHSSSAAETISMQKMFSSIYLVRRILNEMCGKRLENLKCVALTDNQSLFSNLHYLKSNVEDYRLHSDIIELRQSIEYDRTVQEVRYVHSSQNLADCLTKTTKSGHMLLEVVRTGQYDLPGGTEIRDSTMSSVRTWNELMRVEQQQLEKERNQSDKTLDHQNKTDHRVYLTSALSSLGSNQQHLLSQLPASSQPLASTCSLISPSLSPTPPLMNITERPETRETAEDDEQNFNLLSSSVRLSLDHISTQKCNDWTAQKPAAQTNQVTNTVSQNSAVSQRWSRHQ